MEYLRARLGFLPIWAWLLILIGGVYLYVKHKQGQATTSTAADTVAQTFPDAQPMAYSSDYFVNVTAPANSNNNTTYNGPVTNGTPTPVAAPSAPPKTTTISYVVKSGDNLTAIAKRYGIPETILYQANKSTIEAKARQHGMSSSGGGHWIWPGEYLVIPR